MASFPNIAFDVCGICCGHFLMPFGTFFLATFIGKAIIRNSYQSILYVLLCSEEYLEHLIQLLQFISPDQLHLDQYIREVLEEGRESFKHLSKQVTKGAPVPSLSTIAAPFSDSQGASSSSSMSNPSTGDIFYFWWQIFTVLLLIAFFISCISHFAQYYQLTIDQEDSNKLRNRLPHSVREGLVSPTSGKLNLPPPTAVINQQQLQELLNKTAMDSQLRQQQDSRKSEANSRDNSSSAAAAIRGISGSFKGSNSRPDSPSPTTVTSAASNSITRKRD